MLDEQGYGAEGSGENLFVIRDGLLLTNDEQSSILLGITRDAVIHLKIGQNSPVITVTDPASKRLIGFRVVKLVAKEPAGQREFKDPRVQEAIRSQLRDRREQLLKAAYFEVLRDSAKVDNYYAQEVLNNNGNVK